MTVGQPGHLQDGQFIGFGFGHIGHRGQRAAQVKLVAVSQSGLAGFGEQPRQPLERYLRLLDHPDLPPDPAGQVGDGPAANGSIADEEGEVAHRKGIGSQQVRGQN